MRLRYDDLISCAGAPDLWPVWIALVRRLASGDDGYRVPIKARSVERSLWMR